MKKKITTFIIGLVAAISHGLSAQDITGVFFDPRDGQEYETVFIELQLEGGASVVKEWLGQNLNYPMEGAFCYKNYEEYCDTFGRLYNWKAALEACPAGWHLPDDVEIGSLTSKHGGSKSAGATFKEGGESGLNLLMAGFGEANGTFIDVGVNGYYWKRANKEDRTPGLLTIHNGVDYFTDDSIDGTHRNSIRCVRD
ncbi:MULTISPECIES: FISUMP domain-containing protein [Reichenbachiella]|uniref:Major paralogous domain-containing protein n=1 Tax=Reichenbachiella agariperforans TaxID=156994 RepID=A0A1M6JKH5_REIAG|nr:MULTISPECIES: FISUMP domain-containing protein [Reichenbachiella]MBU2913235.1 hypothetical protein [Reichenbachiella agariperforans]RJE74774.1 hypothetical protein BGP76_16715 [Reichenbachiella sp. MSK19-1]SHJ47187.1 major paralogous domain-containing protein [Reichenbachiella agariperforans]